MPRMPIAALPETTVRLLGSAAAISSPVDVVKELLDNALDAEATSVDILVSANLIDSIQVRDNGHGIQADDYDSLGRMGHTSKLNSFEELRNVGGTALGFRGQALASANTLGRVTVVTRCVGDPTATKLLLRAGVGGIESQQRVSAPVGTAVTVEGLYKGIPVRGQVAGREAQKNLTKAKHLSKAYVLARPMVRICLKVLGGDTKQTWSYSPRPGAGIREAIVQICGAGVMAECVERVAVTDADPEVGINACGGPRMTIEAVLPRPGADLSKLCRGSFFSVDSRPVSTSSGTMKKLLSNLKIHFKKSLRVDAEDRRLTDLFGCVNLKCSPGSYDPNIEPSKSQVLFANESQVIGLFEELCSKTYQSRHAAGAFMTIEKRQLTRRTQTRTPPPSSDGPRGSTPPGRPPMNAARDPEASMEPLPRPRSPNPSPGTPRPRTSTVMAPTTTRHVLGRNSVAQQPSSPARSHGSHIVKTTVSPQASAHHGQGLKRKFVVNMSADPDLSSDEEAEDGNLPDAIIEAEEPCITSKEALDPWAIARMTAPARQIAANDGTADSAIRNLVHAEHEHNLAASADPFEGELPIPRVQRGAPRVLDILRVKKFAKARIERLQDPDLQCPLPQASSSPQTSKREAAYHLPRSPSRMRRSTGRRRLPDSRPRMDTFEEDIDEDGLVQTTLSFDEQRMPQNSHESQAQLHVNDVSTRRNPPFRKPKRVQKRDLAHAPRDDQIVGERRDRLRESRDEDSSPIRDHGFRSSHLSSPTPMIFGSSHVDRMPSTQGPDCGYTEPNTFDGDPRKYLIRRQRSEAAQRRKGRQSIKRTKTDRLPLEKVPSGDGTNNLVLKLDHGRAETLNLWRRTHSLAAYREGVTLSVAITVDDVDDIQSRLQAVVTSWTERTFGQKADVEIDLREAVKGTQAAA